MCPEFLSDKVSIYSWNVSGISQIMDKEILQRFIQDKKPDIFMIQETKIEPK